MKIFLIGLMSCGKTTLGKQLAKSMGIVFMDMDLEIERKEGKSIPEIFSQNGEDAFREMEREVLSSIVNMKEDLVVSTGGGAPCFHHNIDVMNVAGVTVFLDVSADEITNRLLKSHYLQARPLLAEKSPEKLLEYIKELLEKRKPIYLESKLILTDDAITISKLLKNLDEMED